MSRKTEVEKVPFINGWAVVAAGSWSMHALPFPLDTGDTGFALCGTVQAAGQGWTEPETRIVEQALYCNSCLFKYSTMIGDKDPRLTSLDYERYRLTIASLNDEA